MKRYISADEYLLWILKIGIIASFFLLLIKIDFVFFPYITVRTFLFQLLIEFLLIIAAALVIFYPEYRPRWNLVSKAIMIYFVVASLTTITSFDPGKSFIGTIERASGLFNSLHYAALFFITIVAFKNQRQWNILFGSSIAVSIYAAFSLLYPVLVKNEAVPATTAGNPTFLSAYLIFNTFFAAHLLIQTKNKWLKIILGAIMSILLTAILFSDIRGALVGICASVLFILAYTIWKLPKSRIILISVLLVLISSYTLIFINKYQPTLKNNSIIQRITDFSFDDSTIKARFAIWKIAFEGFKENPILGWGKENYNIVFNRYFLSDFEEARVGEAWEDRTHNIFIEETINGGLIGLASYIFLIISIFCVIKKDPILMALLVAYIIQNLFGVDTINSYIPFFIFMAYASFLYTTPSANKQIQGIIYSEKIKFSTRLVIFCISTFVITISSYLFTIKPVYANIKIYSSLFDIYKANSNYFSFEKKYNQGLAYLNDFPALKYEASGIVVSVVSKDKQYLFKNTNKLFDVVSTVIRGMDDITNTHPHEYRLVIMLSGAMTMAAELSGDLKWLNKAEEITKTIKFSSPPRQIFQDELNRIYRLRELIQQYKQNAGEPKK